jgi:hypothetical protein
MQYGIIARVAAYGGERNGAVKEIENPGLGK